jgi:acyl-CoA reductase-like NAD-dependent aldehyde dehydrogenase
MTEHSGPEQRSLPTIGLFIDGVFTRASDSGVTEVIDPTTGQTAALLSHATAADIDSAVMSARRAFDKGSWRNWSARERQQVLEDLAKYVEDDADRIARIEAADTGLPLTLVREGHVPRAVDNLLHSAASAVRSHDRAIQYSHGQQSVVTKEPVGVAAIITPWNSPISICTMSLAAAVAAGNCCVVKPSELAPLSIAYLARLIANLGLPPGVVNILHGGPDVSAALIRHPGIDRISFTGSIRAGRQVMAAAAARLVGVTCELGGGAPCIVLPDADADDAASGILWSAYGANGAACISSSTVYVHRSISERLAAILSERVSCLRTGDPLDTSTDIGPLISLREAAAVRQRRGALLAQGGVELAASRAPDESGQFVNPSLVQLPAGADPPIEEIAGPLCVISAVDDPESLCGRLNQDDAGLAAYVWGSDRLAARFARRLRFGSVAVNGPIARDARTPFGGFRQSGVGRVGGAEWEAFWTETKSTTTWS